MLSFLTTCGFIFKLVLCIKVRKNSITKGLFHRRDRCIYTRQNLFLRVARSTDLMNTFITQLCHNTSPPSEKCYCNPGTLNLIVKNPPLIYSSQQSHIF